MEFAGFEIVEKPLIIRGRLPVLLRLPLLAGGRPLISSFVPVAQLDRAVGFYPTGCGFDSCQARHKSFSHHSPGHAHKAKRGGVHGLHVQANGFRRFSMVDDEFENQPKRINGWHWLGATLILVACSLIAIKLEAANHV